MDERRKFPRLNVADVAVNWRKETSLDCMAKTKNISKGGFCLVLDKSDSLDIGDIIQLEFHLPKGAIIYSKGKVAWIDTFEIIYGKVETYFEAGIEFLDLGPQDSATISHFVLSHLPSTDE
jgi:hypothetical protein